MNKIAQAAEFFADHRRTHQLADNLPHDLRPHDLATAYAIQQSLVKRLLDERGGQLVGYKIACTNPSAQRLLGMAAPVFGRLLSSSVHHSPTRLRADDFHIRCIESEYAFQMGVNGQVATTGCGANVLGHPLEVLAWLANELPCFGLQLQAGDRVTTGSTTEVYLAESGDEVAADFGPLGQVGVSFA